MRKILNAFALFALATGLPTPAVAWWDETHIAVMKATDSPYSSCLAIAADALVDKKPTEAANHFFNGAPGTAVTESMVRDQASRYDQEDSAGHLYGAVLAAYRRVAALVSEGKRPAYAFAYLAHYVGDLSQPLHTSVYDGFNKSHHAQTDGVVNARADLETQIRKRMQPMTLQSEDDVVREVVKLANESHALADTLREGKTLSEEQAFRQLARSATLLRAMAAKLLPR